MDDEEAYTQRLKAAVHYTVGKLCQSLTAEHGREISRQAVAAVAEITFRQCDIFAKDLEAFSRHAKRQTVTMDDVKLLSRRSTALSKYIQEKSEELKQNDAEKKERKKNTAKRKSHDADDEAEAVEQN